jgi:tRNA nucleotidyltransferase (CCA-adding enzyme)
MPNITLEPNKKAGLTVIATHENADFDGIASMLGAKKLYPDAIPIAPISQEKGVREFILNTAMEYFRLAKLKDIDLNKIKRVVLVDTSQMSRTGQLAEVIKRADVEVHVYDHHLPPDPETPIDFSIIKPVGATVSILVSLLKERGVKLKPEEATLMALGLYEDTGAFTFRSTTKEDFEAAAYLLECGANLNVVAALINRQFTPSDITLLNEMINAAQTHNINGVPIVITKITTDHYIKDFAVLVHRLMEIEDIAVLFALVRMGNKVFIIARSKLPEVDVADILSVFGGGGHKAAASARVKNLTLIQVENELLKALHKRVKSPITAKDLMSYPVKWIPPETTIEEAESILVRYDINALPILKDGKLVGIITRPVIDRALFHGLKNQPVRRFMTTEFPVLRLDSFLNEIKEALLQHKQRLVPVVEEGEVVGVITRKDLLHYLLTNPSAFLGGINLDRRPQKKYVASLLQEKLPAKILNLLKEIGQIGDELGYNVYVVGGFVRDLLLRRENFDIDIVVEGDGIKLAQRMREKLGGRVHPYQKFGTAVVVLPDEFQVDIATARTEYYEFPGAMPKVETSSLKLDLYRRDFTINTLAIKLNKQDFGLLMDFFGGQRDLKDGIIRVLHNLSFVEDPTRILRAVRFEKRFDFKIGKQTLDLMRQSLKLNLLVYVKGARIWHELKCIFLEKDPAAILRRLAELDVLQLIHTALVWNKELEKLFAEVQAVLSWFELLYLEENYKKEWVFLLALLDQLSEQMAENCLLRLEWPESKRKTFLTYRQRVIGIYQLWWRKRKAKPSEVYFTLQNIPICFLLYLMAKLSSSQKRWISEYFTKWRHTKPLLTGHDLKKMGLTPGPIFKKILDTLLKARLDGEVKTYEDEKNLVAKLVK